MFLTDNSKRRNLTKNIIIDNNCYSAPYFGNNNGRNNRNRPHDFENHAGEAVYGDLRSTLITTVLGVGGMRHRAFEKKSSERGGISDVSMSSSVRASTLAQSVFDVVFRMFIISRIFISPFPIDCHVRTKKIGTGHLIPKLFLLYRSVE